MVNRIEAYFVAYYAYFTAKLALILKTLGQFENLVSVIMPTRENIHLIARTSFSTFSTLILYVSPGMLVFW